MANDIAISVKDLTKTYRHFGHPGDRIKQFNPNLKFNPSLAPFLSNTRSVHFIFCSYSGNRYEG